MSDRDIADEMKADAISGNLGDLDANADRNADTGFDADAGLGLKTDVDFDLDADVDQDLLPDWLLKYDFDEDGDDEYSYTRNTVKMELYDWMQCIVSAVLCGIFIFVFIGRTIGVEGNSMRDTLHWNDRVVMSGLFYTPKNGDIVIFRPPTEAFGSTPLVKRIIAVEGQTIDINFDTGEVFIDGNVIDEERYIHEPTHSMLSFTGPVTVPKGHVFVMGDNRNHSSDSRDSRVGMVDTRYILGKVLFLLVPGGMDSSPRDWSRIGFVS